MTIKYVVNINYTEFQFTDQIMASGFADMAAKSIVGSNNTIKVEYIRDDETVEAREE